MGVRMVRDAPHRESTPRTKGVCIVDATRVGSRRVELPPKKAGWRLLRQSGAAVDPSVRTTGAVPNASTTGSGSLVRPDWRYWEHGKNLVGNPTHVGFVEGAGSDTAVSRQKEKWTWPSSSPKLATGLLRPSPALTLRITRGKSSAAQSCRLDFAARGWSWNEMVVNRPRVERKIGLQSLPGDGQSHHVDRRSDADGSCPRSTNFSLRCRCGLEVGVQSPPIASPSRRPAVQ